MKHAALRGKKVLITAGPTWIALDPVRVISNISTGSMGVALAEEARKAGASVDLFLGPVACAPQGEGIKIFRFTYFDELKKLIASRLEARSYDVILHAAAVSDYEVRRKPGKISSRKKDLVIRLRRAPKLTEALRRLNPRALLVIFKLESVASDAALISRARRAMRKTGAGLAVANRFQDGAYHGFVLDETRVSPRARNRSRVARYLFKMVKQKLGL